MTEDLCIELHRYEYDIAINTLQLFIHFSLEFVLANGALQRIDEVGVVCHYKGSCILEPLIEAPRIRTLNHMQVPTQ